MEWKWTDSPVKKKFRVQSFVKKVILTICRDIKDLLLLTPFKKEQLEIVLSIHNSLDKIRHIYWTILVYIYIFVHTYIYFIYIYI